MFPTLLQLGPITLHSYGLMIAIGFIAALTLSQRDAQRRGIDPKVISEMAFVALFLGIVGTRVLYIIMFHHEFSWTQPWKWIAIWEGGLVFQGAIPPTFIYVIFAARRRKLPFWTVIDCAVPYLALAQASGRIGCMLNGCCFGMKAEHLPWAVRFPSGSPAYAAYPGADGWSCPVHPTQIYSVIGLLALCGILILLRDKWNPFPGCTMPLYLMFYGIMRFINEMFRGDNNPTGLGAGLLTDQQVFSIVLLGVGIVLFAVMRQQRPSADPPPPPSAAHRKKKTP